MNLLHLASDAIEFKEHGSLWEYRHCFKQ